MRVVSFLLFLTVLAECQNSLNIEFVSGIETGWWVYSKGSTEMNIQNNLGWDRTRHNIFLPAELGVFYQVDRYSVGAGINYSVFFVYQMVSSNDTYSFPNIYRVADNSVKFLKMNLHAEFDLIQKIKYSLSPIVKFGFFHIDSTHPQKENFGRKTFWTFGITNEIKLSRISLIVRPVYNLLTILPHTEKVSNEKHNVYSMGLNLGIRYSIR
jgi:hypothetical protein